MSRAGDPLVLLVQWYDLTKWLTWSGPRFLPRLIGNQVSANWEGEDAMTPAGSTRCAKARATLDRLASA